MIAGIHHHSWVYSLYFFCFLFIPCSPTWLQFCSLHLLPYTCPEHSIQASFSFFTKLLYVADKFPIRFMWWPEWEMSPLRFWHGTPGVQLVVLFRKSLLTVLFSWSKGSALRNCGQTTKRSTLEAGYHIKICRLKIIFNLHIQQKKYRIHGEFLQKQR